MHHLNSSPFDFILEQLPNSPIPLNVLLKQELVSYFEEVRKTNGL